MKLDFMKLQVRDAIRNFYFRPDSSDNGVIKQIFYDQDYDLRRLRRFQDIMVILKRGRTSGKRPLIVDAGANIGASSLYFSTKVPDALVVAIEPEVSNYQFLVENTVGLPVESLPRAIAASPGRVRVIDVGDGFWAYQTRPINQGERRGVKCVTVNEIYKKHVTECFPFIVKIDIEGGEKELFSSNVEWIEKTPLIIIELHDWLLPKQHVALPFLQCVSNADRDFVHIGENIFSIANNLDGIGPHDAAR